MRVSLLAQIVVFSLACPAFGQIDVDVVSESIVRVRAYRNNKVAAEGSGFVVNGNGDVLTNAHLLANADRVTVLSPEDGCGDRGAGGVCQPRDEPRSVARAGPGIPAPESVCAGVGRGTGGGDPHIHRW